MKRLMFVVMPFLLSSCGTATLESNLSKSNSYAPQNEIEGGIVSYSIEGATSLVNDRRQDAYKKMYERCDGKYKIIQESERLGDGSATPIGGILFYGQQRDQVIKFECIKA